jgi:hypothetical protein
MNWYKIIFAQKDFVTIDMTEYINSLRNLVSELVSFSQGERERVSKLKIDENEIIRELQQLGYPNIARIQVAFNRKEWNLISNLAWSIYKFYQAKMKSDYTFLRKVVKNIDDYSAQLSQGKTDYDPQQAENDVLRIVAKTKANMEKIAQNVRQAISRIEGFSTPVIVQAREVDKNDDYLEDRDDASIEFGVDINAPSFTYFTLDGKIEIDDVLEAGDSDFFTNSKIQSDYFNLVKELRRPGSSSGQGKVLTLYTARPIQDRHIYMEAKVVPSNLFLTSNYNSAEGIALDFAGREGTRDVWKIRIDSRYLVQTLDSPMEKQYQVVGDGSVPVVSMTLISPGENK